MIVMLCHGTTSFFFFSVKRDVKIIQVFFKKKSLRYELLTSSSLISLISIITQIKNIMKIKKLITTNVFAKLG